MFQELATPCLLVEISTLQRNLARAATVASEAGVVLRPHIKTHKCPELARRQHEAGATGFTVATLAEAAALLESGFDDIFLAYPVVEAKRCRELFDLLRSGPPAAAAVAPPAVEPSAARISVVIDHPDQARFLDEAACRAGLTVPVRLEVDCGHHRCGLPPGPALVDLARTIDCLPGLFLEGVFTHAGHAYGATSPEALAAIGRQEGEAVVTAARMLREAGLPAPIVSVGSTPTMAVSPLVPGVTEMRPGNYVFHDAMQVALGVCGWEDCALTVLSTVIGVYSDRVVIDAGSKAVGLDRGAHGLNQLSGFGRFLDRPDWVLARLSEEHGVVELPAGPGHVRPGDRVRFVPNHACAAVNLHSVLNVVDGERISGTWAIRARR